MQNRVDQCNVTVNMILLVHGCCYRQWRNDHRDELEASLRNAMDQLSLLDALMSDDGCNTDDVGELYEAVGHLYERVRKMAC